MGIFNLKKKSQTAAAASPSAGADLATLVLNNIAEGVLMIDARGLIQLLNPAAAALLGYEKPDLVIGLEYTSVLRLQNQQGKPLTDDANPLIAAVKRNEAFSSRKLVLVTNDNQHQVAIHLTMVPAGGPNDNKIITFRDITKELAEENEQAEFISTASHEMRTPVAAIEGYLGLALSPQTATIDDRARQYLTEAHKSSQHLGELFKDLLDVTKLDDGRLRPTLAPIEVVATVKQLADDYAENIAAKHLTYTFGTADATAPTGGGPKIEQLVYASLDVSFLREIMDNLIGNAVKYTPEGGSVWVNVRGDGDKVLINVTDSGIGISADDLTHIFQKFYRVDNSATRQIGGTGLGLYLVKQRVEAMGGRIWAESVFGEGSTFYVSFPRLTEAEYNRLKLASENSRVMQGFAEGAPIATAAGATEADTSATLTTGAVPVSATIATPAASVNSTAPATSATPATPVASTAPAAPTTPAATPAAPVTPAATGATLVATPVASATPATTIATNSPATTTPIQPDMATTPAEATPGVISTSTVAASAASTFDAVPTLTPAPGAPAASATPVAPAVSATPVAPTTPTAVTDNPNANPATPEGV